MLGDESTPSVGCLRLGAYSHNFLVDIKTTTHDCAQTRLCVEGTSMIFSNDQTDAVLNTLGEEQAAAWARFYTRRATPKITLDQRAYIQT